MSKKVRLRVEHGTDEVNSGTHSYRVDPNTDTVTVDEEAVGPLLKEGGCMVVEEEAAVEVPEGMVRLAHPSGCGCSFEGHSYEPDKSGSVVVPAHAAAQLGWHGFVPVEAPAAAPAAAESAPEAPAASEEAAQEQTTDQS